MSRPQHYTTGYMSHLITYQHWILWIWSYQINVVESKYKVAEKWKHSSEVKYLKPVRKNYTLLYLVAIHQHFYFYYSDPKLYLTYFISKFNN